MADKERRNSLIRSSISINSIRDSASEFSKGLTRTNVLASGIIETTRKRNLATSRSTAKDNEYFRKRRENIRRKNREDELESSTVSGVTKKEGNILQRSTKGFLGRILDFFGVILIGWFVNTLPKILDGLGKLANLVKSFVGLLSGFVEGVKEFFTGLSLGVKQALDSLPKFDFINFKNESEKDLKQAENAMTLLNTEFQQGVKNFAEGVNSTIFTKDVNKDGDIMYGEDIEKAYAEAKAEAEGAENEGNADTKKEGNNTGVTGVNQGGIFGSIGRIFSGGSTQEEEELDKELETDRNDNFVQTNPEFIQTEAERNAEDEKIVSQANEIGDKGVDLINKQKEKDEKSEKDVDVLVKNEQNKLKNTIGDISKRNQTTTQKTKTTSTKTRRQTVVYRGDEGALKMIKGTGVDALSKEEAMSQFLSLKSKGNDRTRKENFTFRALGIVLNDKFGVNTRDIQTNVPLKIKGRKDDMGLIVPIAKGENNLRKSKNENTTTVVVKEVAANGGSMGGTSVEFNDRGLSTLNAMVNNNENDNQMEKIHTLILNT